MTIEEKAKAYDIALDKIKMLLGTGSSCSREELEYVFPELKESEGEKIRKGIVEYLEQSQFGEEHYCIDDDIVRDYIAWLEKQGEQKPVISNNALREGIAHFGITQYQIDNWLKKYVDVEKQGEQNYKMSVNKVEPKFKEGDWVIDKQGIVHQISNVIENVTSHTYGYDIVGGGYFNDNTEGVRLWTIQDAKDGDVLFQDLMCGKTFIYNGVNSDMAILYSFIISNDGEDVLPYHIGKLNTGIGTIEENKNIIHPATKEQRDLLFQKMHEAGYEWDADAKQLKKVEQKPTDEEMKELLRTEYEKGRADGIAEMQKPWSEEDETNASYICAALECYHRLREERNNTNGQENLDKARNWLYNKLKSLRPQNTWKPSDLPHWKKSTLPNDNTTSFNSDYFCHKGYNINYKELFEKLPKDD